MFFRKLKPENKAKLEHKLYLAKETPEPIFDLSECDIKQVPTGIYSLCRVFLKDTLKLNSNCLTSLSGGGNLADLCYLKILDISHNSFTSLPEDIGQVLKLQEFHASNNSLKSLPMSICDLKELRILDLSNNKLKQLPEDFGNLVNLRTCDLTNNHLKSLPATIINSRKLIHLNIDHNFDYPPQEVVERGLKAIMQYICDDTGVDYEEYELSTAPSIELDDTSSLELLESKDHTEQERARRFLEIERQNELLQRQEMELAEAQKECRKKLLSDIVKEQEEFDSRLLQIQYEKEQDKFRLIEHLHEAEQNAFSATAKLLAIKRGPLLHLLEFEKQEEERMMTMASSYNEHLRKADILEAMQNILKDESAIFENFTQQRIEVSKSILQSEQQWQSRVSDLMNTYEKSKGEVMEKLQADVELQKAALGALLERNDARSWGLMQQVSLVESQLAALTQLELDRRKLKLDEQMNEFAEKRVELSNLLMDLLEEQDVRRSEIRETLKALEKNWDKVSQDYWLKQYQAILSRLPEGLAEQKRMMKPLLMESLLMHGVIHCVPYLAKIMQTDPDLENVTEQALVTAGVSSKTERLHILESFKYYMKYVHCIEKKSIASSQCSNISAMSAVGPAQGPSAPPLDQLQFVGSAVAECVVCMDHECEAIFVPCGHIVCCSACSSALSECPLCRTEIKRKIRVLL